MATREIHRIHCREHGGYFNRPAQRGRPPVRCTPDNQCDAVVVKPQKSTPRSRAEHAASVPRRSNPRPAAVRRPAPVAEEVGFRPSSTAETALKRRSLDAAKAAKAQLEDLGWTVVGKGLGTKASVTAARGEELLVITWVDGVPVDQTYSLWNPMQPSANGNKPKSQLDFDPDEVGDRELTQLLLGQKVTWYNRLSQHTESAIVGRGTQKLAIEHVYDGQGEETPGARVIKFIDGDSAHFKAFRVDQLIKVG